MRIKITQDFLDFLEKKRVYLRPFFNFGNALGQTLNIKNGVIVESYSRISETSLYWDSSVKIGAFSYIANSSYLPGCDIGRFCSIGMNVNIMGEGHPLDRVTTSTWTYGSNIQKLIKEDFNLDIVQNRKIAHSDRTKIHSDVWIADNVSIKRGVKLGTGCVVGANSVVTKNIPPYAIVAGNPARIIRYRFDEDIIQFLLASKWWKYSPATLAKIDLSNMNEFINLLEKKKNIEEYEYEVLELHIEAQKRCEIIS